MPPRRTIAGVTSELAVGPADVAAAAAAIAGAVVRTPVLRSDTLSRLVDAEVWVKFENLQYTASFKERGALNRLLLLSEAERHRGVIAMSAGNHAQGVAYHAARLAVPATIVMPRFTPNVKVRNTEALGARVVLHGDDLSSAADEAARIAAREGLVFVAPYDDVAVIAGQGTVALEMLADAPVLDTLVIPVGGGGLIAGMAVAARDINSDIRIVGVQSELYATMVPGAHLVGGNTIAEGIAVPRPGKLTVPIVRALVDEVVAVREAKIEEAVNLLLDIEKTVVEGAGAAPLAALLQYRERFAGRHVGLVLAGGNIDMRVLSSVIMRGLVRDGRLARLSVVISDLPGSLSRLTAIVGEQGGNIVDVVHQRLFTELSVKSAVLQMAIETRDRHHTDEIVAAVSAAGYEVIRDA